MKVNDVIIIGGGAAGMMASGIAAKKGADVVLLEKNPVLGKKLLITGKGRCNLTNYCEVDETIANTPKNGKFLTNSLYQFDNHSTIRFFNSLGLETIVERGNRVFPRSGKSKDVIKTLINFISKNKVKVIHKAALDLMKFGDIFAVKLVNEDIIRGKNVIITTGGKSYPKTGSTGDGYKYAGKMGHKITNFTPSLVPINAKKIEKLDSNNSTGCDLRQLKGLKLKNVAIKLKDRSGKTIYEDFGEMIFKNYSVDGPIILSASSHIRKIDNHKLIIDLKPALNKEQLDSRLQRDFKNYANKHFKNVLKNLLPAKIIPVIIKISGIPSSKPVNQITREERKNLILALSKLTIPLIKFRPITEGIITSGGVDVSQIDPKTMESKIVPGLFFAGEILDCDAYTGGFNLQIAWSTGYAAGISCL